VAVALALSIAWSTDRLPTLPATTAAAALVLGAALVIALLSFAGRLEGLRLGAADHRRECERIVTSITDARGSDDSWVFTTSCGIVLSGARLQRGEVVDWCFTVSGAESPIRASSVARLSRILAEIVNHRGPVEIRAGRRDIVHLVMRGASDGCLESPAVTRSHSA
jgi:hypothetical protein